MYSSSSHPDSHAAATERRALIAAEISQLELQGNTAEDWARVEVGLKFDPACVWHCTFRGHNRLGNVLPGDALPDEFPLALGLRHATLIDCELGDWVVLDDVGRLERVRIGSSAVLWRVGRVQTRGPARFGAGGGIEIDGQLRRQPIEIQNENGRRALHAWPGMTIGAAALAPHAASDATLRRLFLRQADQHAALHADDDSAIGPGTVLLDCRTLINVQIGADARIEGADWLEDLTIFSSPEARTRIGAGVELRRGIVGYGNTIASGTRAADFLTGENVTLDMGLRLSHSAVGDNSHLARGEVSNALVFPNHQQHHNNSFLIAARLEGTSNIAAGVTLGSNHNSRSPDGEIVAARGFWPGLCTNFKHNSRFAPFTLLAKGNYAHELNIELPFALVSNSEDGRELRIAPGWWWNHNAYALARNEWKLAARDKRVYHEQPIETRTLAPDTVEAMLHGIQVLTDALRAAGRTGGEAEDAPVLGANAERSRRPVRILRPAGAQGKYRELCRYYATRELVEYLADETTFSQRLTHLREVWEFTTQRETVWLNLGGQLVGSRDFYAFVAWLEAADPAAPDPVKAGLDHLAREYPEARLRHACAVLRLLDPDVADASLPRQRAAWERVTEQAIHTAQETAQAVRASREKDFTDPFRKLTVMDDDEFAEVYGRLEDDDFITRIAADAEIFAGHARAVLGRMLAGA